MAFEPGGSSSAVPARTAVVGAVLGVMGLAAALVFGFSLSHLASTPRLSGWTWDFKAPDDTFTTPCGDEDFGLSRVKGVGAVAAVCYEPVQMDRQPTVGWGFTPVKGSIGPEVVAGRAPTSPTEVALGATTLHALHKHVGDTVEVAGPKGKLRYTIVGRIVLPQLADGDVQPLAEGAAFTGAGFLPLVTENNSTRYLVGDVAKGADEAAVLRRVSAVPQFNASPDQGNVVMEEGASGPTVPPEVDRLRHIGALPPLLALLLSLLALTAVTHALVTTTRRRRGELAVLQSLGFRGREVRATLAWQATALGAVGLLVGLPLGAVLGNLIWRRIAGGMGMLPVPVYPVVAMVVSVPIVLGLVNLVGFWPARTASRLWPARALTTE
jgi:hypothetical protein